MSHKERISALKFLSINWGSVHCHPMLWQAELQLENDENSVQLDINHTSIRSHQEWD